MSEGRAVLSMNTVADQSGLEMEIALLREQLARAERRVEELTALADRDPLVGVLNRRAFTRETARAVAGRARHGHEAVLVAVDVEGLKGINDAHGRSAGDAALAHVGQILAAHVRTTDAVGRLCADEFAILLAFAGVEAAEAKMDRLARRVATEPVSIAGTEIIVPIRFAAAAVRPDAGAEDQLALLSVTLHQRKAPSV